MAQITGGKITYGRTVKTGDYENKRADVELSFSVDEGETVKDLLDTAANMAQTKAHEVLGLSKAATVTTEVNGDGAPVIKRKPGRPPNPDKAAAQATADAAATVVENPPQIGATVSSDQSASVQEKSSPAASASVAPSNPAAVSEEWETPAEITDKDLSAALAKRNAEIKNPMAIKKLIGQFAGVGKFAAEIPQALRQDFLKQLSALTAQSA